jgi:hypothetical protein
MQPNEGMRKQYMDDELREFLNERFEAIDRRFAGMDQRFDAVDERFAAIDQRFETIDWRFADMDQRFATVDQQFGELGRELTARIDGVRNDCGVIVEAQREQIRLIAEGHSVLVARVDRLEQTLTQAIESMGREILAAVKFS